MAKPNLLNAIKLSRPKKSIFDLSHDHKLSCNMGDLVPVLIKEAVPSDRFQISQEALVRFEPLVAPMMHRCNISFHTFFVPTRLLWPNFDKWVTNQKVAGFLPAAPYININGAGWEVQVGSLLDHMGIPPTTLGQGSGAATISAFPLAAYQLIYNEYYRDQNLSQEIDFELNDGDNTGTAALGVMRKRAWEHDYFTAAAPEAQAGAAVDLPIGSVELRPDWALGTSGATPSLMAHGGGYATGDVTQETGASPGIKVNDPVVDTKTAYDPDGSLQTSPTTINDLRTAFRLQEWLEKSMRGGKRLFENILIFFGLRSPDARMQRPEYVGGSVTPIQISEVLNTTGTDDAPQGTMAGHGVAVINGREKDYVAQEWGYFITIMSVLPRTAYQQGIERMWLKTLDPMQYYWPQFDHLGEQAIENQELYAYGGNQDGTFGYIPRYAEYKFSNSRVSGQFRDSYDFWHMGRIFDAEPALDAGFVESDPTHRVFAVTDPNVDKLIIHVYNKVRAIRPMSKFSTPSF